MYTKNYVFQYFFYSKSIFLVSDHHVPKQKLHMHDQSGQMVCSGIMVYFGHNHGLGSTPFKVRRVPEIMRDLVVLRMSKQSALTQQLSRQSSLMQQISKQSTPTTGFQPRGS